MNHIFEILGFLLIVFTLVMQWEQHVRRIIILFAASSLVIALFLVLLGLNRPGEEYMLFILAGLTIIVRGITIPVVMNRALNRLHNKP